MIRFFFIACVLASTACTRHLPDAQRRECQQLRGKAAVRGIFMPVGIVVVALYYALSSDTNADDGRHDRRRERRRHRREVCRDIQRALPPVSEVTTVTTPAPIVLPPPNEGSLERALREVETEVRACVPNARGLLTLDAALHGRSGRITSFDLEGEGGGPETRACLDEVLRSVRFEPFEGALRVRWGINLSGQSLPAPWSE